MSGKITGRDSSGKIVKGGKTLTSEQASALAAKRWDGEKAEAVGELLAEFGYASPEDAPRHLSLLAEKAAVSGSGSVTALVQLIKALRAEKQISHAEIRLQPGDQCPTCKQYYNVLFSADVLRRILEDTGGAVINLDC